MRSAGRGAATAAAVAIAVLVAALVSACTPSSTTGFPNGTASGTTDPRSITFATVDAAMNDRVTANRLDGAGVLVVRDGREVHRALYGSYAGDTVVAIASASKWLASATIMTLVDEGKVRLDDPVGTYLPTWAAGAAPDKAGITIRQLLSHQAGLSGSAACLGDPAMTLGDCADQIAGAPLAYPPGTDFRYGNAGYTVAARVAEVAGGAPIEELFQARIARPLGMIHTSFSPPGRPANPNPVPAASGVSTLDDYGRFVAMMLLRGTAADGTRILSSASVGEIVRDQVAGLDTKDDFAVEITGFPTYGLGVWRDRAAPNDDTQMVSGSGSVGFYPWVDFDRHAYGVVLVEDGAHSSGDAVRASTRLVHDLILPALDNTT
jgi:CubicO group peptidase (beta-lactamase class C family)